MNSALAPEHVVEGPRGRYRIVAEHGRGGFGVTYRGEREVDGLAVIVKTLHLAGLPGWKAFELFEREAAVLRALQHRNVPAWIDDIVFGHNGDPSAATGFALVMELIPGRTLRDVARSGGMSASEMTTWLRDVLEVLVFIHGRSPPLIHRDVNPKNIILRPDGSAALVDFGCVQAALRSADTVASTSAGTFGYAPLEQFIGQATPVSDLYSLGMTFLATATGQEPSALPFEGLKVNVRRVLRAPPHLVSLIEAMVEPDPRFRISSAAAALEVLTGSAERSLAPVPQAVQGGDDDSRGLEAGGDTALTESGAQRALAAPGPSRDYLHLLRGKLVEIGFEVEYGVELAQSRLDLAAHSRATGWAGIGVHLYGVRGEAVAGARGDKPLPPVPAALFVQTATALHAQDRPRFWSRLLGQRQVVVPLFACTAGVGPRTRGHIAAAIREPGSVVVVPAIVDLLGEGFELITPPSLLAGDPGGVLEAVRRLLSLPMALDLDRATGRLTSSGG